MVPALRQAFNALYTPEMYAALRRDLERRCGTPVEFQVSETPCFFPKPFLDRIADDGKALIRQLVDNPDYYTRATTTIPPEFNVPNEAKRPMFIQVDFGIVRDHSGNLNPKLVELQAFPSLYAYQPQLAQAYIETCGLDPNLKYFLSGLDGPSYNALLKRAIVGDHDPENVILMDIDPQHQKTLPDFLCTERLLGVRPVCITKIKKTRNQLSYDSDGKSIPIHRIYNRAIVDELERKGIKPAFDFRDDLDVEWAGHPNWYFRISKYSIPYLHHDSVPRTWFLDQLENIPDDLENYALKPLYSFAGLGVIIAPTKADIVAVPRERRSQYILQERLHFEPVIETPYGGTKVEVRVMYIWLNDLLPVLTILRMGRGLQMGVDHNRNVQWVGSSAAFYE
jgi:hypothetical protein